jgi:hypothetical protein
MVIVPTSVYIYNGCVVPAETRRGH